VVDVQSRKKLLLPPGKVTRASMSSKHCLYCDYIIDGLAERRCPECGRPFDVLDAKSYGEGRLTGARRSIKRIAVIVLVASIVVVALDQAMHRIQEHRITEFCMQTAEFRKYTDYKLGPLRLWRGSADVHETSLSKFLQGNLGYKDHRWVMLSMRRYQWRSGTHVGRNFVSPLCVLEVLEIPREKLDALQKLVPDLPNRIYADVLGAREEKQTVRCALGLADICGAVGTMKDEVVASYAANWWDWECGSHREDRQQIEREFLGH
jgi:hypothetical protein